MADLYITCDSTDSPEGLLRLLIRDADCEPYITCDNKDESAESLIKRLFSDVGDGTLALNVCECDGGLM